jgi:muramoyltetrapeptide carboxypeptidase
MARPLTFCVVAPSGAVRSDAALARAQQFFRDRGMVLDVPAAVRATAQRFAGNDDLRLAALHEAAARDDVDVIVAARGGYGLSRVLDRIDYDLLASSGKIFVGHSDFTALSLALLAKKSYGSFAGPHAVFDFGAEMLDDYTIDNFFATLRSPRTEVFVDAADCGPVNATGMLWGGNLSLVAGLVGTPYLPSVPGGILFLEDVAEHPYRIERMLYQLFHAGVLQQQRAILLGDFSEYRLTDNDAGYDLASVVAHFRARLDVPLFTGLPFGHMRTKVTLPVGAQCELRADATGYRLRLSGYRTATGVD